MLNLVLAWILTAILWLNGWGPGKLHTILSTILWVEILEGFACRLSVLARSTKIGCGIMDTSSVLALYRFSAMLQCRIGIRSSDVKDSLEKTFYGIRMALSSPRLSIPAGLYTLWAFSAHYSETSSFTFHLQVRFFQWLPTSASCVFYSVSFSIVFLGFIQICHPFSRSLNWCGSSWPASIIILWTVLVLICNEWIL
jgi:hypothetical protein